MVFENVGYTKQKVWIYHFNHWWLHYSQ